MSELRRKVLVVDDEPGIRDSLRLLLKGDFDVSTAEDGKTALDVIDETKPNLVLLDVMMPNLSGVEALREIRTRDPKLPVIMLTAANSVKTAVESMKCGAVDYLNKPFDVEELIALIRKTFDEVEVRQPTVEGGLRTRELPPGDFGPMVGRAPEILEVFKKVAQVAERDSTVLITGESGTGKELIARQIHILSARRDKPFVAINCAAIPETLIESELFGHEKGAFTNAVERRIGHCELADGGTLFLDEIGELSLPVQVKMLRFLQEQEFYRVGRSKPTRVDVRIITATNKNLEEQIKAKQFRQDLYYRINVINIKLPPLRDRYEDIPYMAGHFVKKFLPTYGNRQLTFSAEALKVLTEYDWPGNVRELENVIESLMALCAGDEVRAEDLPRKLKIVSASESYRNQMAGNEQLNFEEAERKFESEMITKALKKTNYVQTRAAELLGISRRILKYKMDKLGISDRPEGGAVPEESEPPTSI